MLTGMQVLAQGILLARDAGRERMLVGILRVLGAVSERSSLYSSRVIASRCVVPAFQLLSSRLPAVRQVRPHRDIKLAASRS